MRLTAKNKKDRLKIERKHCESDREELAAMSDKRKDLLRCYSPPVSVDTVLEVQHSQPPDVHIEHVVIKDALWWENRKNRYRLSLLLNQVLIAVKLKSHSTHPVCCINTTPTSS